MSKNKKQRATVYMAGPDVFRHDVEDFAHQAKQAANAMGLDALFPCDNLDFEKIPKDQIAKAIFEGNIALMDQADYMVANTNAWRGLEPDSGTCWEMAYMYSQGKPVIAYRSSGLSMVETVNKARLEKGLTAMEKDESGQHWHEGNFVENFSNPLNLMLQQSISAFVIGDVAKAFECVASMRHEIISGFALANGKKPSGSNMKMC